MYSSYDIVIIIIYLNQCAGNSIESRRSNLDEDESVQKQGNLSMNSLVIEVFIRGENVELNCF